MRISDWSSDVCSSDLAKAAFAEVKDPALQKQFDEAAGAASKSMRALADWLEKQRKDATQDFALGPERFARMLKTTELVHVPISELEKIGRADMKRNQEALQKACAKYAPGNRSEEHTSALQSLMSISYAVFCLKKKKK